MNSFSKDAVLYFETFVMSINVHEILQQNPNSFQTIQFKEQYYRIDIDLSFYRLERFEPLQNAAY